MKKLDSRTVRLFLKQPDVTLIDAFCAYFQGVVPVGYNPQAIGQGRLRDVGTGPFKVESFTPGRQSVHVRNENYWREGQPYFDSVVIIDFPNDAARVNAFLGGQVDAITDVPFAQVPVIRRRNNLRLYEAQTGGWLPISMRVDVEPFNDVRVRQAFRLIADRRQMVNQALSGHGRVGNDVYSPFDLCYAGSTFAQRQENLARARQLLAAAGQEDLSVELVTSPQQAGMVEAAQIFAQNAQEAGVTVTVRNVDGAVLYGDDYLKWPFSMDFWGTRNYLSQVAAGSLPTSSFNATQWNDPEFNRLYRQALRQNNRRKRCALVRRMQRIEYERGGHIVWGFFNLISAYSSRLGGFKPDRGTLDLNKYGNGFRTIYFV
jgi:peptide/nickel transport system substrate-binding protein